jgi:threonine/homoserine/homoserine lactone efflux protein
MTLAMSLGMTVGYRKTLWMITGALLGLILATLLTCLGIAGIFQSSPTIFFVLKTLGGTYLCYLGYQIWKSKVATIKSKERSEIVPLKAQSLFIKGFLSVVANPKGWAFFISLLPPFIDQNKPLAGQLAVLIPIILTLEFGAMSLYAAGGSEFKRLIGNPRNVALLNKISGTLIIAVGIWLFFS